MLDNLYYPHALQLPSPEITYLSDCSPDFGYQVHSQYQAGVASPCYVGTSSANPVLNFTSEQLYSLIGAVSSGASSLAVNFAAGNVDLFYRAGKVMAIHETNATAIHLRARLASSAMLFWNSIQVQQGGVASMNCTLATAKRTSADPMVWTGSNTLTVSASCNNIYGMGPVYLDDVLLEGVTGWTMNTNVQQETFSSDGVKSPNYQGIRSFAPTVSLQTNNMAELVDATYGGDGYSTLVLYLRKMASTSMFVDYDATTNIAITVNGGLKVVGGATGSPGAVSPMFYAVEDPGTTPTHSFNAATALPADPV